MHESGQTEVISMESVVGNGELSNSSAQFNGHYTGILVLIFWSEEATLDL